MSPYQRPSRRRHCQGVLANDTDVDGGRLNAILVSGPSNATSFTLNADGTFTYTPTTNFAGQDTFTYRASDGTAQSAITTVTITVNNVNDTPTAIADTATAVEAGGVANGTVGTNPTGNVLTNDTDIDSGDTKTVSGVAAGTVGSASTSVGSSVAGSYGSINIASNGAYTYTVDNNNAIVQALRTSGQSVTDVFTYTMRDTAGLTSTTQITVTIQGANDAPVAVADAATAIEAGGVSNGTAGTNPNGNVLTNDTDPDSAGNGETKTVSGVAAGTAASASGSVGASVTGSFGSINIASNGAYTYTVDNSNATVQALRTSGQTITDVFTYTMTDTAGATSTTQITVTIQGANDAPTAVADTATAVEAGGISNGTAGTHPTGNVLTNDTDPDSVGNGETKTVSGVAAGTAASASGSVGASVTGTFGSINIASNGAYTYTVDNNNATVQALRTSGQTLTDVFTYTMTDALGVASTTQVTVAIQGANDAPGDVVATRYLSTLTPTAAANNYSGVLNDLDHTTNSLVLDGVNFARGLGMHAPTSGVSTVDYAIDGASTFRATIGINDYTTGTFGSVVFRVYVDNILQYTSSTLTSINAPIDLAIGTTGGTTLRLEVDNAGNGNVADHAVWLNARLEGGSVALGVAENSSNGTVVGSVSRTDVDWGDNASYAMLDDASGRFSISSTTGLITVANASLLNYEANSSHTIVVRATDVGGLVYDKTMTVSVSNVNETPDAMADTAIAVEASGTANGTAGTNPTGNVLTNDTDVDSGDGKTVSGVTAGTAASASGSVGASVTGSYGSVNIASDGSYTYSVDNVNATVQALRLSGQTITDVFTYTVTDTAGATSTTQITVTIQGANDAPVAVAETATAVEAGGVSNGTVGTNPTGNVLTNDTDPDSVGNGETKTVSGVAAGTAASASGSVGASVTGAYGSISIASDGSYTYTVDNANATVQALRTSGQTITDVFTYTMTDAAGATSTTQITVTIQGANDAPTAVADTATAVEAGGVSNGTDGTNPTGNVLTNDTDPDSVGNGETKTVVGVLAGTQVSASGNVASSVIGTFGSINIASNGSYTYTVDNSNSTVQALRTSGNTITDVFTYTMTDALGVASTTQITVTIQGANDTPTSVADTATAVEAGGTSNGIAGTNPTGNVLTNDTDVDSGDSKTVSGVAAGTAASASGSVGASVTGTYGSISIASDGSYTYNVDNANSTVEALRTSGQTITDVFTYTMTDTAGAMSTTQITVTIQGANDAPVAVADTATAVEAGGVSNGSAGTHPTGNVLTNDTDPDSVGNGETKTVSGVAAGTAASASGSVGAAVTGTFGSINIASNGSYTYTVDNSNATVQALRTSGQTITDVFTYTMTDTAGATSTTQITVTIQGANDAPVAVADTATAVEAGGVSNGTAGTNPTGNVLTNDTDPDSVGNGESNTVSGVAAGTAASASGSVGASVTGSFGAINIASNGAYTYTVDNSNATVQALRTSGQTITDVFTYTMTDTAGATSTTQITVTIQGANDAPTAVVDTATAVEAGGVSNGTAGTNPTGNVLTNDTDPDSAGNGETKTVSGVAAGTAASASGSVGASVTGSFGAINIASNGSYTYTVDNSNSTVQALRTSGQTIIDVFTYTMTDTAGATSTAQITVTIQGANDAPTAVADTATAVEAGGISNGTAGTHPTGNVLTNDTDPDSVGNGETKTVSGVASGTAASASGSVGASVTGAYGSINIASNGSYTYTVDNSNATVQALRTSGQTITDVFTYTMTDTAGATSTTQITVTIQGANDAPTAVADAATAVEAGGVSNGTAGTNPTGNVLTNDTDVDSGDGKTVIGVIAGTAASASGSVGVSVTGAYGSVNIASDGSYIYAVDNANATVQALRLSGQTITDVFTYTVTDTDGLTSTTQITITIQGANDTPYDLTATGLTIAENSVNGSAVGTVARSDVDASDTPTYSLLHSAGGRFAIDASTGAITVANSSLLNYEAAISHNITVRITDLAGATYDEVFTVTLTDVNEFATSAITDTDATPNAVNENVTLGTAIGITAFASDADATTNIITYSLFDNDSGNFAIDANTGVVTTAAALNRETLGASRNIIVRATSADGSYSDQSYSIAIGDIDEFDVGAISDNDLVANAVNEFAANGSVVGLTTLASDNDATTNAITYSLDNTAGGRFAIHASTGVVTVADGSLLDASQATSHVITVRATSTDTSFQTQTFTISVTNLNDTPTAVADTGVAVEAGGINNATLGSNPSGNVLANDTDPDFGDSLSILGVAAGVQSSALGSVGSSITGAYGSIVIQADGSYSYSVDNSNATVQALRTSSDTLTDVFTYSAQDTGGLSSTTQITITLQGRNDNPYDLSSSPLAVDENSTNGTVVGSMTGYDVDASDTRTYSFTNSAGGRFAIHSTTGQITVADGSLLNFEAATQHSVTVRVTDANGASYDEAFLIQLNDRNESPIANSDSAIGVEAGGINNGTTGTNPNGNVLANDTDVDAGDTQSISGVAAGVQASVVGSVGANVSGSYGAINIASDGSYTYLVDNNNLAVQSLRTSGQTLTDVFSYTMVDSGGLTSTAQVTITIQGQNDNPVVQADQAIAIEASGYGNAIAGTNPTGNVLANDSDVDAGDSRAVTGVASGVQPSTVGSVASSVAGAYGTVTINADGSYAYVVDNSNAAVQALRTASDTIIDVFSYTVTDTAGATSTTQLTITIQGRNDGPTAVNDTPMAIEAGGVNNGSSGTHPIGNVLSNDGDVDLGDSMTVTGIVAGSQAVASGQIGTNVAGAYGSLLLGSDGSYTYTVDNANATVQALRTSAQTLQDVFTYTMEDGGGLSSTDTITVTIQGANDAPTAVANTATAVEAGGVTNLISGSDPTGNVLTNDTDVDAGDTKTVTGVSAGIQASTTGNVGSSVTGTYGSLVIQSGGVYTYTLDNNHAAVEALNNGQTLSETFSYTLTDASGATSTTTLVITIQGADDLPFAVIDFGTAVEAGGLNNATVGSNPSGNVLANDIAPNGEFVIGVAAGVAGNASGSVGVTVAGLYGSVVIQSDGSYTYTLDNSNAAVQALRISSDHLTDYFTYTLEDSLGYQSTTQLTISIDGRNDAPTANHDLGIAVEAGGLANGTAGSQASGNVLTNDTDVDSGDTQSVTGVAAGVQASTSGSVGASLTGLYGSLVLNQDGSYSYTVDNNNAIVQALRTTTDTLSEIFTYTMEDTAGANSLAYLTITIQGANDAPIAVADNTVAIEAGGVSNGAAGTNPTGNVFSNDTDVDAGDTKTIVGVAAGSQGTASGSVGSNLAGSYGSVILQSDGSYAYTVDNTNAAVQLLRTSGETLTEIFTYTLQDSLGLTSTTQLTITIQGANDSPHDLSTSGLSVAENSTMGTNVGIITSSDIDSNEVAAYSLIDSAGGRFGIHATTGMVSVANSSLLNYEIASSHFVTVRVTDLAGAIYDEVFEVFLTDVNEFATSAISDTDATANSVDENASIGTFVSLTAFANDADATSNIVTYSLQNNDGGNFAIDANTGVVTTAALLNRETLGATRTVTIRATSTDGSFTDQVFTIAINDVDEFNTGSLADTDATANAVDENASIGTSVGIMAQASDLDATNSTITYSLFNNDGGNFAVDANTGVVITAAWLDREALGATRLITVRATSMDGSFTDQVFAIELNDLNEFNTGTVADTNLASNTVDENVSIGTMVGIVASASDGDATNNTITYTLFDHDGGNFAIDANSGVVTTAATLDRESLGATRSITVRATSADGSHSDQVFTIAINDLDEFDTSVITDTDVSANAVNENAAIGTTVGTIAFASDTDATSNSVSYALSNDDNGNFAIDANTGIVTTAAILDREILGATRSIIVRATSADGSHTDQAFLIIINDLNEFNTGTIADTNLASNTVDENVSIGTMVGIVASASDGDATNNTITYSLFDHDGGNFAIDANSGVVTTAAALDRESLGATRSITVRATSADGSHSDQVFAITINDLDEFDTSVITDTDVSANAVSENAAIGTTVGIIAFASDADATNNLLTYALVDDAGGRFTINAQTGVIVVANSNLLDYEASTSHTLIVRAVSSDGSFNQSSFTVQVLNQQERPTAVAENYTTTYIEDVVVAAAGLLSNDSDPDGDRLTAVLVSGPATGTLTLNSDGSVVYDPAIGIDGVVSFVYRAFDGVAYSDSVTVTIVIGIPAVQAPNSPVTPTNDLTSDSSTNASPDTSGSNPTESVANPSENTSNSQAMGAAPAEAESLNASNTPAVQAPMMAIAPPPIANSLNAIAVIATLEFTSYSWDGTHWLNVEHDVDWKRANDLQRRYSESHSNSVLNLDQRPREPQEQEVRIFGNVDELVFKTVIGAGAVIWVTQGIQLLATLLSVTPAWLHIDPQNIVIGKRDEEESENDGSEEERMFDR